MGVYVKGMKMPKDCRECPFEGYHVDIGQTYCMACLKVLATAFKPISFDGRSKWCPLVELHEPHGKLVEFIDVTTYEDDDSGTEEINLGEVFAAYLKMRESKPIIEVEGE